MQLFGVLGSLFRLDPRVVVRCSGSGVGLRLSGMRQSPWSRSFVVACCSICLESLVARCAVCFADT